MIRLLFLFFVAVALVVCGTTVKFGKRTLYGHIMAIWDSPATKDARDGIKEKAGPVVKDVAKKAAPVLDEVEKKAKKAVDAVQEDDAKPAPAPARPSSGSGSGSAAPKPPSKW